MVFFFFVLPISIRFECELNMGESEMALDCSYPFLFYLLHTNFKNRTKKVVNLEDLINLFFFLWICSSNIKFILFERRRILALLISVQQMASYMMVVR